MIPATPQFGIFLPQGWRMDLADLDDPVAQYEAMTTVAQQAEQIGFDSVWIYDHFHTVPTPTLETCFEAWMCTAGLVRDTTRIRVGQMVTCNSYRNPALLAKMASTVDVMSHGRLDVGIGAGWYAHEYAAYGYPFPPAPVRLRMLAEALPIMHALWTEAYATFAGEYYQVQGAINEPKGVQRPHPPLWIGGAGEKVTLRLVARWGDGCNISGVDPALLAHKLAVLRAHCVALGRDFGSIRKSADITAYLYAEKDADNAEAVTAPFRLGRSLADCRTDNFVGTPADLVRLLTRLYAVGIDTFVIYLPTMRQPGALTMLGEVLDTVRAAAAAGDVPA